MAQICLDLVSFADGELEPERAEAFRAHLPTCAACQAGLVEALQLSARLGALTSTREYVKLAPELPAVALAVAPAEPPTTSTLESRPRSTDPRPKPPRRIAAWVGAAAAAMAAVVAVALFPRPGAELQANDPFPGVETRPFDIRFAYPGTAPHRPMRGELRGAGGSSTQAIPYAALAWLQDRKDSHGLAIGRVYNGEDPARAVDQLRELAQTPSIQSDRAALEILTTATDNVEPLLAELDALRGSPDPMAARAARWNYAILLGRLELPLSAAKAFQDIADEHEAGWADEARHRAEIETRRGQNLRMHWDRAIEAGEALVKTGAPVPPELVAQVPGLIRAYLYDAVTSAPDPRRVLALAPLAADLDRLGGTPILSNYVRRVASLDFRRRAPLAAAYAQLRAGEPLDAVARAALTSPAASADVADIVMTAMRKLEVAADHVDAYRRMAKQSGDPWFEIMRAHAEADAAARRSDWIGAEAHLREAQALCSPAVTYRCLSTEFRLATLYQDLHRVTEALAIARAGVRTARSAGEWGQYLQLLFRTADAERFNSSMATARAYANELLITAPENDAAYRAAQIVLVSVAIRELDGRSARRALDLALRHETPNISAANNLADIGRLDPQPGDLAQLQGWLGKLRTSGTLTPAEQVLADEIEGRLLVETDRTAGIALLDRAIAAARTLPREVIAERARTGSYSVLVFDAARHGEAARVMALTAQELDLPTPGPCAVALVAEDERAVVAVRGADARDHAAYNGARRPGADPLMVSAELARYLEGCGHVQVMAQAALQGQPHVLPAKLAWSYATGAHPGGPSWIHDPSAVQTLVVTGVTPPPELRLPALSPQAPDPAPSTHTLTGPTATPAQVLAAMRNVSEIQFHTHALVNMGVSDASYLVLSPEPDGRYALTAEVIRGTELRGRPIVVLAACHSAQGARYQHASWSLPHAFLAAGARGVFAAATAIPDLEAGAFFTRVLERVRGGTAPAAALRDERMTTLASQPLSWVADVVLFE